MKLSPRYKKFTYIKTGTFTLVPLEIFKLYHPTVARKSKFDLNHV